MPAAPAARRPLVILVGLGVMVGAALLVPLPRVHRVWGVPMDLAHAVLAAGLTWTLASALARYVPGISPTARPWAAALLVGLGMGGLEAAQGLTGRSASLHDLVANGLGALGMALVLSGRAAGVRHPLLLAAVPWFVAVAHPAMVLYDTLRQPGQLPTLASFEDPLEMTRWASCDASIERTAAWHSAGGFGLEARFRPGPWPSISLIHPAPDWRGWRALAFDVHALRSTTVHVKVVDRAHNEHYDDRFNGSYELPAGWSTVEIPIAQIEAGPRTRRLDLERVDAIQWFLTDVGRDEVLRVDTVRLVR